MKINKSAARTADLLMTLAQSKTPMTLLELEQALETPKSSTFELLHTLVEAGFLEQTDKKYSIGLNAFLVGASYVSKLDLAQVSKEILAQVSRVCKETVFLGHYAQNQIVYVAKHASYTNMASTCRIGSTKGLYYTGLGKAVLGCLSEKEVSDYFSSTDIQAFSPHTITTLSGMKTELSATRQRGYAVEYCEGPGEAFCVAAPILNYNSQVVGATSITASTFQRSAENEARYADLIATAALEISRKLGYTGPSLYQPAP